MHTTRQAKVMGFITRRGQPFAFFTYLWYSLELWRMALSPLMLFVRNFDEAGFISSAGGI